MTIAKSRLASTEKRMQLLKSFKKSLLSNYHNSQKVKCLIIVIVEIRSMKIYEVNDNDKKDNKSSKK